MLNVICRRCDGIVEFYSHCMDGVPVFVDSRNYSRSARLSFDAAFDVVAHLRMLDLSPHSMYSVADAGMVRKLNYFKTF